MIVVIDNFFSTEAARDALAQLQTAQWFDGKLSAGSLSETVKTNLQLDPGSTLSVNLGSNILQALGHHPLFVSAALPEKIYPPKFNCYKDGGEYGAHIDSAVMLIPGERSSMRSDISATLFLSDPDTYDGGELQIETAFGMQAVKLNAGDLVLYPSTSLHQVTPVTRGSRISAFFWVQSLVADEAKRSLLFDLDQSIQAITAEKTKTDPNLLQLTGVYHNLLRRWAKP